MRYIDADALLAKQETIELPDPYGGEYHIDIVHSYDVKKAPTADVVRVVRCRDCKLRDTEECPMTAWDVDGVLMGDNQDYDYCSYGERREEDSV